MLLRSRCGGDSSAPAVRRPGCWAFGEGQMGSALMGSLHLFLCFSRDLLGTNLSKYVNIAYLFTQSVKNSYFCSDPISVDPICPQPRHLRPNPRGLGRLRGARGRPLRGGPAAFLLPQLHPLRLRRGPRPGPVQGLRQHHEAQGYTHIIYIYIYICTHTCTRTHVYVYVYVYVYVHVYVYVYVYVYV